MQGFIIVWLIVLTVYVVLSNKATQNKIASLLRGHSTLFWALKNKKVIDVADLKDGGAVVRGEKMGNLSLKDFMDVQNS